MTFSFHCTHNLILKFIPYLQKLQNSLLGVLPQYLSCVLVRRSPEFISLMLSFEFYIEEAIEWFVVCSASLVLSMFLHWSRLLPKTEYIFFSMQALSCITSLWGQIKCVHVDYYCDSFGRQLFVKYCNFIVCWNHSSASLWTKTCFHLFQIFD